MKGGFQEEKISYRDSRGRRANAKQIQYKEEERKRKTRNEGLNYQLGEAGLRLSGSGTVERANRKVFVYILLRARVPATSTREIGIWNCCHHKKWGFIIQFQTMAIRAVGTFYPF